MPTVRYNAREQRNVRNVDNGIYNSLTTAQKSTITLQGRPLADGYAGVVNLTI